MSTEKEEVKKDKKQDWAEMSDDEAAVAEGQEDEADKSKAEKPKKKIQGKKGFKNERGDYVVTSIDIPDMRTGVKKDGDGDKVESESDSDDVYDDEDDEKDNAPKVEEKKAEGKWDYLALGLGHNLLNIWFINFNL